jgi:hypothetical protein
MPRLRRLTVRAGLRRATAASTSRLGTSLVSSLYASMYARMKSSAGVSFSTNLLRIVATARYRQDVGE